MDVTVAVGTFGSQEWAEMAHRRAIPSAERQAPVVHVHGETLADARNRALAQVETEWVIHLDADDELEPGFVEAMARGTADLRAPAVSYVRGALARPPYVPKVAGHTHDCTGQCLPHGNWLVIGSCARTALLREVGGWEEWPLYEDWALWFRAWKAGATVEAVPDAVYRAWVRSDSRNRAPAMEEKNRVHGEIVESVLGAEAA